MILAAFLLTAAVEIPTTMEACERRVLADPAAFDAYLCFTDLVRMHGHDRAPVESRLEHIVDERPSDPRPRLALAGLLTFRDGQRAVALTEEALDLALDSGDLELIAGARVSRAIQHAVRGENAEAEDAYEAACASAERTEQAHLIAACVVERGRFLAFNTDQLARGWSVISGLESRPWYPELPARMRAHYLSSRATIGLSLGRTRDAYKAARQMLVLTEGTSLEKQHATAQWMIVSYAASLPDIDRGEARRFADESIAYFERHGMLSSELGARFDLSRWVEDDEAQRQLQIVERESRKNPFCRPLTRMALRGLARRALEADPPRTAEALDLYGQALEEAESFGGLKEIAASRADVALASLRDDPQNLEPAWDALAAIEALVDRQSSEQWNMELFSKRSPIYYSFVDHLIRQGDLETADGVLRRMRARRLRDHLRRSGIANASATQETAPDVASNAALLSFALAPDPEIGSWLLVRTADALRVHPLDVDGLGLRVDTWRSLITQRDPEEPRAAARVYRDILQPALDALDPAIDRLIVVPDGVLHRVPFGALRAEAEALPLATRYRISISASTQPAARPADTAAALLFADPYPDDEPIIPAAWRDLGQRPHQLGSLPFARREVRDARAALGDPSTIRVGAEASESEIKRVAPGELRLLHLAIHAVVDEERPERSALILASSDGEDGWLQPREIASMPLAGVTVILPTCHSAGGRVLVGEGPMSLARAFFEAGAPTVVAGLWDLQDEDTADLMSRFYRRLTRGDSVARSLTGAQREMIDAGRPAAAWAGLVVLGAGDARPWPAQPSGFPVAGGVVLVTALGALLLLWTFRRTRT